MIEVVPETSAEDIRVQINVRLQHDELLLPQTRPAKKAKDDLAPLRSRGRNAPSHRELLRLACRIYDARRERERLLGSRLFGEPGWDMMLALYCLPARGERLAVTALSLTSGASQTTALRWQAVLIEEGLIRRVDDNADGRRSYVDLTEKGRTQLEDYLLWLWHANQQSDAEI